MQSPAQKHDTDLETRLWQAFGDIPDPEIPVISITDLGIIREIDLSKQPVEVVITPTYTGCPAMHMIEGLVREAAEKEVGGPVTIRTQLTPPWSTDWLDADARERLRDYGISPPMPTSCGTQGEAPEGVPCPRCGSEDSELVSRFGSTPCKAHYKCRACLEPFDYFKCI